MLYFPRRIYSREDVSAQASQPSPLPGADRDRVAGVAQAAAGAGAR